MTNRYRIRKVPLQRMKSAATQHGRSWCRGRKVSPQSKESAVTDHEKCHEHGKDYTTEHGKFRYRARKVHYKLPKVPGYFPCLFFLMVSRMPSYDNFPDTARKMIFFTGLGRDPCGHYPTLYKLGRARSTYGIYLGQYFLRLFQKNVHIR